MWLGVQLNHPLSTFLAGIILKALIASGYLSIPISGESHTEAEIDAFKVCPNMIVRGTVVYAAKRHKLLIFSDAIITKPPETARYGTED